MTGVIEAYRAATLGRPINWTSLGVSTVVILVATAVGAWRFRKMERTFADIV
jgi:ABC-type polysaccharide/polyol phosphate export permease